MVRPVNPNPPNNQPGPILTDKERNYKLKNQLYKQEFQRKVDKAAKKRNIKLEQGATLAEPYFKQLARKASESHADLANYHPWEGGMMEIMQYCITLNKALWYWANGRPWQNTGFNLFVWEKSNVAIDWVKKNVLNIPLTHQLEKDISYAISIDEQGKLQPVLFYGDQALDEAECRHLFTPGVIAWLKYKGYDVDNNEVVKHADGSLMTSDELNHVMQEMQVDDLNGLHTYLEQHYDMPLKDVTFKP